MKKKLAIIGTIALLGVGGFTVFNLNNPDWRANSIFATARDKQLAWLKEHEEEIVKWIHSVYPKVESVQFDWNTLKVRPVSNGVSIIGYNLLVKGTFNDIPETIIIVDFLMETADSIPKMSQIRMNQPPSIKKDDGGVYGYE
jgi:lipoprotein